MSRHTYAVLGLGVMAAALLAIDPLLAWARISAEIGLGWWVLVPAFGAPLLCLVATLVGVRSYWLRSVAAGVFLAIGLLTVWRSAWRLVSSLVEVGWLSLAGGLVAIAAGLALLALRTPAPGGVL